MKYRPIRLFFAAMVGKIASAQNTWDPTLEWDFQCHSHTHPHLDRSTAQEIHWEMEQVNDWFQLQGYDPPAHHAYPFGGYSGEVPAEVAKYRLSGRVVWGFDMHYPITNWFECKAAQLKASTGWQRIKGWIDDCIQEQTLLSFVAHDVSNEPSNYGTTPEKLAKLLDYLLEKQSAGLLEIVTMAEAYDYWSTVTQGRAMVVVGFDDANESDYTLVYGMFRDRGIKGTSYLTTGYIGNPGFLTASMIKEMRMGVSNPTVPPTDLPTETPLPTQLMHVIRIDMVLSNQGPFHKASAVVTVTDENNDPVDAVTVTGSWTDSYVGEASGVTDGHGQVTLDSGKVRNAGMFVFTVENLVKTGWTYDSEQNVEDSDQV